MPIPTFKCRDFYLASYLVYHKFPLLTHFRENGTTTFLFSETPEIRSKIDEFLGLRGTISDAQTFCGVIRSLKTLIHSGRAADTNLSTPQQKDLNNEFNNQTIGRT